MIYNNKKFILIFLFLWINFISKSYSKVIGNGIGFTLGVNTPKYITYRIITSDKDIVDICGLFYFENSEYKKDGYIFIDWGVGYKKKLGQYLYSGLEFRSYNYSNLRYLLYKINDDVEKKKEYDTIISFLLEYNIKNKLLKNFWFVTGLSNGFEYNYRDGEKKIGFIYGFKVSLIYILYKYEK